MPDRITGILGVSQLNPQRRWNFVEVGRSENLKAMTDHACSNVVIVLVSVSSNDRYLKGDSSVQKFCFSLLFLLQINVGLEELQQAR